MFVTAGGQSTTCMGSITVHSFMAAQVAKHVIKTDEVGLIINVLYYGSHCLVKTFLDRRGSSKRRGVKQAISMRYDSLINRKQFSSRCSFCLHEMRGVRTFFTRITVLFIFLRDEKVELSAVFLY